MLSDATEGPQMNQTSGYCIYWILGLSHPGRKKTSIYSAMAIVPPRVPQIPWHFVELIAPKRMRNLRRIAFCSSGLKPCRGSVCEVRSKIRSGSKQHGDHGTLGPNKKHKRDDSVAVWVVVYFTCSRSGRGQEMVEIVKINRIRNS